MASWELKQPEDAGPAPAGDGAAGEPDIGFGTEVWEEPSEDGQETDEDQEPEDTEGSGTGDFWRLFGIALPVILAGCLLLLALENGLDRYRYGKKSPEERLRMAVFRNLEILSWLGISRREWETLQELRERAEHMLSLAGVSDVQKDLGFIEDYENVLYGRGEAGEDMLQEVMEAREGLLGQLKETRKWAYFYCRVRLRLRKYG